MLIICPSLKPTRDRLLNFLHERSLFCPHLNKIILDILSSNPQTQTQFFLDPCHIPSISDICVSMGFDMLSHIYYLTRTFVYYMHRAKMISQGRWPGDPGRKPKILAIKRPGPGTNNTFPNQITNISVTGSLAVSNQCAVPDSAAISVQCPVSTCVHHQYQHRDTADTTLCSPHPVSTLAHGVHARSGDLAAVQCLLQPAT